MKVSAKLELSPDWHNMRRNLQAMGEWGLQEMDLIYLQVTDIMLSELIYSLAAQFVSQAPEMVKYVYMVAWERNVISKSITEDDFFEIATMIHAKQDGGVDVPDWLED